MRESEYERVRREVTYLVWRRMTKTAAILGVVNAALAALLAFGVSVSNDQQAAIVGGVNALLVAITAFVDPKIPFVGVGKVGAK